MLCDNLTFVGVTLNPDQQTCRPNSFLVNALFGAVSRFQTHPNIRSSLFCNVVYPIQLIICIHYIMYIHQKIQVPSSEETYQEHGPIAVK